MESLNYRPFMAGLVAAVVLSAADSAVQARTVTHTHTNTRKSESSSHDGWLGVYLADLGPVTRGAIGLGEDEGVAITGLVKGGASDVAGLMRNDVVVKIAGNRVGSESELREQLRGRANQTVRVEFLRAGKPQSLEVKLGDRTQQDSLSDEDNDSDNAAPDMVDVPEAPQPPDAPDAPETPDWSNGPGGNDMTIIVGGGAFLGVEPQDLGRELGEAFGVQDGRGVLFARIIPGSPADKAGLKAGDVLTNFDGKRLESASDLRRELRGIDGKHSASLEIIRKGERRKYSVELNGSSRRHGSRITLPDMAQFRWQLDSNRGQLQSELRDLKVELRDLRAQLRDLMARERR